MNTFIKTGVTFHEFKIYEYINSLNLYFVPRLINYDASSKTLTMQFIKGMTFCDFYGEKFDDLPAGVKNEIRNMISNLYENNIIYPDITGYNFLVQDRTEKFWLVDFEHCFFHGAHSYNEHNKFVEDFIEGKANSWNSYFA